MELKYSIKRAAVVVGILALVSLTAVAQEIRSEVSIEGTGFFTNDSSGNGVVDRASETGGFLIGYRYNFNRWLAAEANYGYDRNTQMYFGSTLARVQSDIHQFTGSAVVKLPGLGRFQPYALAGGGALVFEPTGNAGGIFAGATQETRGTFLYGLGADFVLAKHWSIRAEYRGLAYKAPDFDLAGLNTDSWTNISQPSAPASSFGFNNPRPKAWYGCSTKHPYHTILRVSPRLEFAISIRRRLMMMELQPRNCDTCTSTIGFLVILIESI